MTKVLHIIWSSTFGGIETLVFNLSLEQKRQGRIFPVIFSATKGGELLLKAEKQGITTVTGNFLKGRLNLNQITYCKLVFSDFDILHIHSFNPIIAIAAILSKKKIIYTEHGNFGFHRKSTFSQKIIAVLFKQFLNRFTHFITFNSDFTKATAHSRYELNKTANKIVYNGIPNNQLFEINNFKELDPYRIGTVGRLVTVKKIDRIIRAMSNLKSENNYKLEIIGDGPEKNNLISLTVNSRVENNIEFKGYQNKVDEFYTSWSLMIIPSSGEAFGLVVLEAYKHGIPVVIFEDGGGMLEIVSQVDSELIVNSENELTHLLEQWPNQIRTYHTEERISKRKHLVNKFSIEATARGFEKIYKELLCAE